MKEPALSAIPGLGTNQQLFVTLLSPASHTAPGIICLTITLELINRFRETRHTCVLQNLIVLEIYPSKNTGSVKCEAVVRIVPLGSIKLTKIDQQSEYSVHYLNFKIVGRQSPKSG